MPLYGAEIYKNHKWAPGVKLNGVYATPAEPLILDPSLLPLGADPRVPNNDFIGIPRGRIVAMRTDSATYEGTAVLTIADGVDPYNKPTGYQGGNYPIGFAESNIFLKWKQHDQMMPVIEKQAYIEVPYVSAINDAYGTLQAGDRLMPYMGTVTSITAPAQNDKGKLVKWKGNKLYSQHLAASGIVVLASAIYPAFPPVVVMCLSGGVANTGTVTLAWTGSNWKATLSAGTITDILYTMGADRGQVCGELVHIEPLSATHHFDGWLEYVTDDLRIWDYPPNMLRVPVTAVTAELPTYVSLGNYRLAHFPIAPYLNITVTLAPTGSDSFTIVDELGTATTVAAGTTSTLGFNDIPEQNYTFGKFFQVNPTTGELSLSTNVIFNGTYVTAGAAFYAIQVSYSYETAYRNGRLYAAGQMGLTDGLGGTGYAGTPANLDIASGAGSLRALIY